MNRTTRSHGAPVRLRLADSTGNGCRRLPTHEGGGCLAPDSPEPRPGRRLGRLYGRGRRNQHPEDYPEYVKGGDIVSFDIYPVNHESARCAQPVVCRSRVERLVQWSKGENRSGTASNHRHHQPEHKPTPQQVRAEVWMSLITARAV